MTPTPPEHYSTQPLTPVTWDDFAALVEANNGVWGGCWCIGFHPEGLTEQSTRAGNREATRAHVDRRPSTQRLPPHRPGDPVRRVRIRARPADRHVALGDAHDPSRRFRLTGQVAGQTWATGDPVVSTRPPCHCTNDG